MRCDHFNGVLYRANDTELNSLLVKKVTRMIKNLQLPIDIGMYNYTPQIGYFNLATSQNGIHEPEYTRCRQIYQDGTWEKIMCEDKIDYICQSGEYCLE